LNEPLRYIAHTPVVYPRWTCNYWKYPPMQHTFQCDISRYCCNTCLYSLVCFI